MTELTSDACDCCAALQQACCALNYMLPHKSDHASISPAEKVLVLSLEFVQSRARSRQPNKDMQNAFLILKPRCQLFILNINNILYLK